MRVDSIALLSSLLAIAAAHGGLDAVKREAEALNKFLETRSIKHCMVGGSNWQQAAIKRRSSALKDLRKRNLISKKKKKRDLEKALNTNHKSSLKIDSPDVPPEVLFKDASCVLHPEATEGPYYIKGEELRYDITENQKGVPFYVELLVMDVDSCEPVPDAYLEYWNANALGVYSGVVAKGNGDYNDKSNVDNTFLRGVQKSDKDGVVRFKSIFPGYYADRTTHVHIVAHTGGDVVETPYKGDPTGKKKTISLNAAISHVGQFFFDENLRDAVEDLEPYKLNQQKRVSNREDRFIGATATGETDPFMTYAYIGDDIEDGIMGWIVVGVQAKAKKDVAVAGYVTEKGGVFLGTHYDPKKGLLGGDWSADPEKDPYGITSPPYPSPVPEFGGEGKKQVEEVGEIKVRTVPPKESDQAGETASSTLLVKLTSATDEAKPSSTNDSSAMGLKASVAMIASAFVAAAVGSLVL